MAWMSTLTLLPERSSAPTTEKSHARGASMLPVATNQPRARDLTGTTIKGRAWREFVEASALITNRMERRLYSVSGLKMPEYNLLLALTEAEGNRLRMGELAERIVFSPSRLSYQVKSLAQRGLLTRCSDENDKRGMTAELTEKGRQVFTAAAKVHAEHVRQLFHPALDDAEAEDLQAICHQIRQNVELTEDAG